MAPRPRFFRSAESFEEFRQRMLDDTSRFIEWGLAHPEQVRRIPAQPVGHGRFTERVKTLFWNLALRDTLWPHDS